MNYKCIIFDCDGVLVDSERISVTIFQKMAAELGFKMDFQTAVEKFAGTSMAENIEFVAKNIAVDMPVDFEKEFRERTFDAFKRELKPVKGIHSLIKKIDIPFCTASSGPVNKIRLNLTTTTLIDYFEGRIFSCYDTDSWKPEPDIYLHAAKEMGFSPGECIVIEDSESGIKAATAGGFDVLALGKEHKKEKFEKLGAKVFKSLEEIGKYLNFE